MLKTNTIEGTLNASGSRFAIVAGRWNSIFTERLVEGAVDALLRHGASEESITIIRVPGCFEIPLTCREAARNSRFDALIAVGTLIEGETDHYRLIAGDLSAGISAVMRETGVPIAFGAITASNMEQAMARAGAKAGNKGFEAAVAAIEMVNVLAQLRGPASSR